MWGSAAGGMIRPGRSGKVCMGKFELNSKTEWGEGRRVLGGKSTRRDTARAKTMRGKGCGWRNGQGCILPGPAESSPRPREVYRLVKAMSSLLFCMSSPCSLAPIPTPSQYQFPVLCSHPVAYPCPASTCFPHRRWNPRTK